ncbi:hypothetical protein L873DRAFT_1847385 [Choiromyces venosus 120613-1]|uniref:Uncharacterized protein n=1 Tax=Choiromyces venosus 120613-1 TaxID=1336337 RepID=A0A3N4J745_9PEZI|nr:hypothetical protein L873DRAFT_1847385 [Choiromyces venosus 120613-1]
MARDGKLREGPKRDREEGARKQELLGRVFGGEAAVRKAIENVVFGPGEEEDWAAWSLMQENVDPGVVTNARKLRASCQKDLRSNEAINRAKKLWNPHTYVKEQIGDEVKKSQLDVKNEEKAKR